MGAGKKPLTDMPGGGSGERRGGERGQDQAKWGGGERNGGGREVGFH